MKNWVIILIYDNQDIKSYEGIRLFYVDGEKYKPIEDFATDDPAIDYLDSILYFSVNSKSEENIVISDSVSKFCDDSDGMYELRDIDKRIGIPVIVPTKIKTSDELKKYYKLFKEK